MSSPAAWGWTVRNVGCWRVLLAGRRRAMRLSSLIGGVGRRDRGFITFLNGIARKRHHSHVRKSPWTTFFNGVVHPTSKQTATPPPERRYPTDERFSTH